MADKLRLDIPVLNTNGTDGTVLLEELTTAYNAVVDAHRAIRNVTVHPRDWQTVDDDGASWRFARDQHRHRISVLEELSKELEELALGVMTQLPNTRLYYTRERVS